MSVHNEKTSEFTGNLYLQKSFNYFYKACFVKKLHDLENRFSTIDFWSNLPLKLRESSPLQEEQANDAKSKRRSDSLKNTEMLSRVKSQQFNQIDATALNKATEALLNETQIGKFLTRMMEIMIQVSGAERGCFILNQNRKFMELIRMDTKKKGAEISEIPDCRTLNFERESGFYCCLCFFF